ncbi:ATP-binding protein, partial [Teichococcus deserti]|uniref:ATP-binding protein n=1 Tax=Teichococcus deserti TaxID=1817963 RepID=UPI001055AC9A
LAVMARPSPVPPGVREMKGRKMSSRMSSGTPGGTGLGLAITAKAMQAHGGGVALEDCPGGGSRFVLTLPPAEASP